MKVLLAGTTSLLWGASNLLDKVAVDGAPISLTFISYGIVSVVLAVGMLVWDHRNIKPFLSKLADSPGHRQALLCAMLGGLSASVGSVLFFMALKTCDEAHVVSAIAYTAPVFTLLLGVFFASKTTKIMWPHVVAMLLIVSGVVIVTWV
jgi:uncharacterized membrane protein